MDFFLKLCIEMQFKLRSCIISIQGFLGVEINIKIESFPMKHTVETDLFPV